MLGPANVMEHANHNQHDNSGKCPRREETSFLLEAATALRVPAT